MTVEESSSKGMRFGLILIVSLFFMWAVAHNLNDILIRQFKKAFELTDLQSGLVQSAFYMGYFMFAMPAAMVMRRLGYRRAIIIGLLLYATGAFLFYPAAEIRIYAWFLGALFVLASGLAFLETAANPYIAALGTPETSAQRLNLAQAFNPLGAIAGVVIGRNFIFSGVEHTPDELGALSAAQLDAFYATEAAAVQGPYLVLGAIVLLWAVMIALAKLPTVAEESGEQSRDYGFKRVWEYRHCWLGVVAQFFYVGAQVGIWSFIIRYTQVELPGTPEKTAADYLTYSLVIFLVGRFVGTAIMRYVAPNVQMAVYAALAAALCLVGAFVGGSIGLIAIVGTSFFMSIMFPTIFALGIKHTGNATKAGSALMVMAIIGGAAAPALMGYISDLSSIRFAFLVPLFCFIVVLLYGTHGSRSQASAS